MPKTNEISFSERTSDGFRAVDVGKTFGPLVDEEIEKWLYLVLQNLIDSHADLHRSKIPKMRRLYDGKPQAESKSFPFPNCSNIVIQVIGEKVDTLTARILGLVFATSPLWSYGYPSQAGSDQIAQENAEKKKVLEEFMDTMGMEKSELNLTDVYGYWCTDHIKLGTAFVKAYIEDAIEAVAVGYTKAEKATFREEDIYFGPKVSKLAHEDVLMDPQAPSIEKSQLVAQRLRLNRKQLEERVFLGLYEESAVEKIINNPDRPGPDLNASKELRKKGIQPIQSNAMAEWDIYECYFPWIHQGKKFRLIYSYHFKSRTTMRKIFNFIPRNQTPIIRAKFGYRTDGAYGTGFAEMLEKYQEEESTVHNNRIDNSTLANTRFFRLDPNAVNIGAQVDIFPGGAITAKDGEFEAVAMADVYQSSFQNEEMILGLADQRAGIAPAITGMGGGGMQGKGKNSFYSAGPAMAAMQESNHRTNLETSDFRHSHQDLGALLTGLYGKIGIGDRGEAFGKSEKYLVKALREFLQNRVRIPIRSSNASLNREIEKQNDMLMIGLMQRHYTAQAQLMQAVNNPGIPEQVKQYLIRVMEGSDRIMKRVLKDFGYDQPEEFIPDAKQAVTPQGGPVAPQGQINPAQLAASVAASRQPVAALPFQPQGNEGMPPGGGMGQP